VWGKPYRVVCINGSLTQREAEAIAKALNELEDGK
jgi:hypothetical protein